MRYFETKHQILYCRHFQSKELQMQTFSYFQLILKWCLFFRLLCVKLMFLMVIEEGGVFPAKFAKEKFSFIFFQFKLAGFVNQFSFMVQVWIKFNRSLIKKPVLISRRESTLNIVGEVTSFSAVQSWFREPKKTKADECCFRDYQLWFSLN